MAVRAVMDAKSSTTVAVPPAARSICALMVAAGVVDADLDGVLAVLTEEEPFASHVPASMAEIMKDVRDAHALYLSRLVTVVDAGIEE